MPPVPRRRSLYNGIYDYPDGEFLDEKKTTDTILFSDNGKDLKWLRHEASCLREVRNWDDRSLVRLIAFGCELLLLFIGYYKQKKRARMVTGLEKELVCLRDLEKRLAGPNDIMPDEATFLEKVRSDPRHRAWCLILKSQLDWANKAFNGPVKSIEDEIAKDAAKVAEVMRASASEAS